MKKKSFFKRAASLMVASAVAATALVGTISAFADDNYTITILPNSNTDTSKANRYQAYQIFTGTLEEVNSNTTVHPHDFPELLTPEEFEAVKEQDKYKNYADHDAYVAANSDYDTYADYQAALKEWEKRHTLTSLNWGSALLRDTTPTSPTEDYAYDYSVINALFTALNTEFADITAAQNAFKAIKAKLDADLSPDTEGNDENGLSDEEKAAGLTKESDTYYAYQTAALDVAQLLTGNNTTFSTIDTEFLQKFARAVNSVVTDTEAAYASNFKENDTSTVDYFNYTNSTHAGAESNGEYPDGWKIEVEGGYYLIIDTTTEVEDGDSVSPYFLDVAHNVYTRVKSNSPELTKSITAVYDSTADPDEDDPKADHVKGDDTAIAAVGDKVEYKLVGTLPENFKTFYDFYYYQFYDNLSEALTIDEDSIKVSIMIDGKEVVISKGNTIETQFADDLNNDSRDDGYNYDAAAYDLENATFPNAGDRKGTILAVTFSDLIKFFNDIDGDTITYYDGTTEKSFVFDFGAVDWSKVTLQVTYQAWLNDKAQVNTGNINEARVIYTNDPTLDDEGDYDNDEDDPTPPPPGDNPPDDPDDPPEDPENPPPPGTGKTPKSTATVFTFGVDINKDDGYSNSLDDAKFRITRTNPDDNSTLEYAVFVTRQINNPYIETDADKYAPDAPPAKITEYVLVAWVSYTGKVTDIADITDNKIGTSDALYQQLVADGVIASGETLVNTVQTAAKGHLNIAGLDAGVYTFTETEAPDGYDVADPFIVTLKAAVDEETDKFTGELAYDMDETTGADTETSVTYLEAETADRNATLIHKANPDGYADVFVIDPPVSFLPDTGGMGRYYYYFGGVAFLLLGAGAMTLSKKKNGSRQAF